MAYIHESTAHLPLKVVIHDHPQGVDELVSAWAALRLLGRNRPDAKLAFVRAGESLPDEERAGFEVVHIDTGRGEFDQHNRPELGRTSSFELFAKHYGLDQDPGIKSLLELTIMADNVEVIDPTSIHYLFKSRVKRFTDPATKETDWSTYIEACFGDLDDLYEFYLCKAKAHAQLEKALFHPKAAQARELENGIRVYYLGFSPNLREAAFERGADVVVTCVKKGEGFYPLIQSSRGSGLKLCGANFALRYAEAKAREIPTKGLDLWRNEKDPRLGAAWFLHQSDKFLCCGSRSHELESPDEFTKLNPGQIMSTVCSTLSKLPPQG